MDIPSEVFDYVGALLQNILVMTVSGLFTLLVAAAYNGLVWLRNRLGAEKFAQLQNYAEVVVQAVEQMAIAGAIMNKGSDKMDYALERLSQFAEKLGVKYNRDMLRVIIETAIARGAKSLFDGNLTSIEQAFG